MDKINFQNGVTPLNQTNLNQMQDNMEEIGVVVSATQPTTNEKVWIQKGKNLFDGELELGGYNTNGTKLATLDNYRNVNIIKVKSNTTYTFSNDGVAQPFVLCFYDSNKKFLSLTQERKETFTTPSNCEYINFRCFAADFITDFNGLKIQLEQGSATEYEAYVEKAIYTKNDNGVYEEVYKESPKSKILWTNPSPTTSMAYTASITLSSSDYDELEFWYYSNTSNNNLMCMKTKAGYNTTLMLIDAYTGNMLSRSIGYISNTSYKINACYGYGKTMTTVPAEQNTYLIPAFIVGIKN